MVRFKPIAQCQQMGVASEYVVPTVVTNVTNQSRTFQDNLRTVFPDPAKKFAWWDVPKILHVQLRKIQVLVHAMGMARLASSIQQDQCLHGQKMTNICKNGEGFHV